MFLSSTRVPKGGYGGTPLSPGPANGLIRRPLPLRLGVMTTLKETVTVDQDIEACFAYIAEFSNVAAWDPGVARSTRRGEGPVGVGSEFELDVVFGRKTVPMIYTVTEFDPPRRIVLDGRGKALDAVDTIELSPAGEGTRIDYTAELTFHNFVRFIEPLLGRTFKKVGEKAVAGLAAALDE
jgi:dehydrogenase/reductase SDR family protein 12